MSVPYLKIIGWLFPVLTISLGTCTCWNVFFTFLRESKDGFANLCTYTTADESSLLWEVEKLSGEFYVRVGSSVSVEKWLKLLTSQNLPHENMPETDEI